MKHQLMYVGQALYFKLLPMLEYLLCFLFYQNKTLVKTFHSCHDKSLYIYIHYHLRHHCQHMFVHRVFKAVHRYNCTLLVCCVHVYFDNQILY
jgi:hypothetical protein